MVVLAAHDRDTATVAQAAYVVREAADRLGVILQSDAEMRTTAEMAIDHIRTTFQTKLRNGQLRSLNKRYRQQRIARAAAGEKMPSYRQWLEQQVLALVQAAADAVRTSPAARHALGIAMLPVAAE